MGSLNGPEAKGLNVILKILLHEIYEISMVFKKIAVTFK